MLELLLRHKRISLGFLGIALLYVLLTIFTRPDPAMLAKYHIGSTQLIVLGLLVVIPYVAIWLIALLGYLSLRTYVDTIRGSKDGRAFSTISHGILVLAFWMPFTTLLSSLTQIFYKHHPALTATTVRVQNYIDIGVLAIAFMLLYVGAKRLLPLIKPGRYYPNQRINVPFIAFSALYVFLALQDPIRRSPSQSVGVASYYLPDWLIVITLLIPRLISWYLGFQAVRFIYFYKQHIKGSIYKSALGDLVKGIAGVIVSIILLRCLQSFDTQLVGLSLAPLFVFIFLLLIIIAIGYLYILRGAKNLRQIEEN